MDEGNMSDTSFHDMPTDNQAMFADYATGTPDVPTGQQAQSRFIQAAP